MKCTKKYINCHNPEKVLRSKWKNSHCLLHVQMMGILQNPNLHFKSWFLHFDFGVLHSHLALLSSSALQTAG